jgi:small-conductance mechanosensitive channel
MVVIPLLDFATSILPYLPGSARWRFASASLFSGFLLTPLLGIALALMVASILQHRGVLRLVTLTSLLSGVVLIALTGLLALDIIELRASAEAEVRQAIVMSGFRGVVKNVVIGFTCFVVALYSRRAAGGIEPPRGESPMAPIVGSPRR